MGPTSSGLDTLMDLATRWAGNSVRPAPPAWLIVARGVPWEVDAEQPRQEIAPTSNVGIGPSLLFFMTSLPSCCENLLSSSFALERAGRAGGCAPAPTRLTCL